MKPSTAHQVDGQWAIGDGAALLYEPGSLDDLSEAQVGRLALLHAEYGNTDFRTAAYSGTGPCWDQLEPLLDLPLQQARAALAAQTLEAHWERTLHGWDPA